jgi:hypothetical protein
MTIERHICEKEGNANSTRVLHQTSILAYSHLRALVYRYSRYIIKARSMSYCRQLRMSDCGIESDMLGKE